MVASTLLVAGSVSIGVGLSFLAVAGAILRKRVPGDGRVALLAYATWWWALALYLVLQGSLTVLASFGALRADLYLASRVVAVPLLCMGVWGITSYLLYLYSGRDLFAPVAVFNALVAILFFWVTVTGPRDIMVERWLVTIDDTSPWYRLIYVVIGVPPILAAAAYLGLVRYATGRTKRYRIVLVSTSIFTYVGGGLAARLSADDVAIFVTLVLFGALTAIAALLAYYPPPRVRAWLERPSAQPDHVSGQKAEERQDRLARCGMGGG